MWKEDCTRWHKDHPRVCGEKLRRLLLFDSD